MQIDEKKLNTKHNNILFGVKEIQKVTNLILNSKTEVAVELDTSLAYLIKLVKDLEKDSNELNLVKSYTKVV
jgi:hypothetical protein